MNSINVIGRLTKDPELKKKEEGKSVCSFTLAIDDIHGKENRADFIRVVVFGVVGERCKEYLKKGFLAGVSGRIRSDSYTDAEGIVRYTVNIIAESVKFLQWEAK